MFRLVRVLPLVALCLAFGSLAHAEPATSIVTLEEKAAEPPPSPTACPDAFGFESRLRALIEQSECDVPERRLLVTLRQAESVSGTLVVLEDYQAEFVREVSGASCGEVESALTLALEIFLDPGEAGDGACVAKDSPPEVTRAPTDWPGQDLDPFNLPEQEREPEVPPPPVIEPQPRGLVRVATQIDTSIAPTVAFGLAATGRARLTRQNFVGVMLSQLVAPPFGLPDGGVTHLATSALSASVGQFFPIGAGGEFSLEIGPRVGLLEVGRSGFQDWEFSATLSLNLTVCLGVRVTRGLWLGVQGGGTFNLLRARYLDAAGEISWEQPWSGAFVGLYVSAALPEGTPPRPPEPGR